MKISEVVGDHLMSFVAVVRCPVDDMGSLTTRVEIRCDGLIQARHLMARVYVRGNVLSIRRTVQEQTLKPIKPSPSVIPPIKPKSGIIKPIKSIKPMTPKQASKKSLADNKKAIKKKERKTKAINRVRIAQNKLADINRQP